MNDQHNAIRRSRLITFIATALFLLSGLATVVGAMSTGLYALSLVRGNGDMAVAALSAAAVGVNGLVVVLAIGLLRRRNWARLGLIAFLWILIAGHVAGLAFDIIDGVMVIPQTTLDIVSHVISLFAIVIFWQLLTPQVRQEFTRASAT
jgi:hypothetical protein